MRVIAGRAKGKRINVPKGVKIRPTTDRVKEAVFSIIGDRIEQARVLDLYAGSGSLGIEALSRGAAEAIFVDSQPAANKAIQRNLDETGFASRARVMRSRAKESVYRLASQGREFDLIFLDPPYRISIFELKAVLEKLVEQKVLASKGIIVLEHLAKIVPKTDTLRKISTRRYGDSAISFFVTRLGVI